jgi:hypothetical protein
MKSERSFPSARFRATHFHWALLSASLFALAAVLVVTTTDDAFADSSGAAAQRSRVFPNAEAVRPLPVGASVPPAEIRTIDGETVDLAQLIRDRGALLVFYRGGW